MCCSKTFCGGTNFEKHGAGSTQPVQGSKSQRLCGGGVTDALESGRRRRPAKISGYLGFMSVQIRIRRIKLGQDLD